ncbi:ArsR/SmtB family transcription factor [Saccharopolyspora mangrovi]|uniref:Metalloregulator ArsR/SmtB family transcription factor n=1 Tax=Saccharopolyspora mangrovi TaxID=3082379 RepID=A0ABU6AH30_9PSEU|nr:metalloregulator ArsR/SmtB family transcription factor [Saccharopolyspora sp. S2-29]MEB3370868.1 metalloregulator ArsR/SmtB family transcription factor [Saccharopolyspora sp. S2-29]
MDEVFRALADPGRRRLLDSLQRTNGQTLRELCGELDMTRQSVSKHLAILETAELITTTWRGREKLHHLNAAPIAAITDRWISRYHQHHAHALHDLATALEDPMPDPDFVYQTHIRTTPEKLWQALTDPEFTRRYWGVSLRSDWKPGSPITWEEHGSTDPEQVVLESDPPHRLAYTWHTFTPDWAAANGIDEDLRARLAAEPRSRVVFELEPAEPGSVKLTVTHAGFSTDSTLRTMISQGWPQLLSSLKTLLETGQPL